MISYQLLDDLVDRVAAGVRTREKLLVAHPLRRSIDSIITYLGFIRAGHAVILTNQRQSASTKSESLSLLGPLVTSQELSAQTASTMNYKRSLSAYGDHASIHPDLAILLATSGSLRAPRYARLSSTNIAIAAKQVQSSLKVSPTDRAITILPLDHVLGLSILHSHLSAYGTVIVSDRTVMDKAMWDQMKQFEVTTLSGIPYTFSTLEKLGFSFTDIPSLIKVQHSGGQLSNRLKEWLESECGKIGGGLFFMYGQTEASGRISVLAPEEIRKQPACVGRAVPFGKIEIVDGQVVYRGPNVMLGYAQCRNDLTLGDTLGGCLYTGDTGTIQEDGNLYLAGRIDRVCKIFGVRLDLDQVEQLFSEYGECAVTSTESRITLWTECKMRRLLYESVENFASEIGIPLQAVRVNQITALPRTLNGKVDYRALSLTLETL